MEFLSQTLHLKTPEGIVTISGMRGVGTGLAYYPASRLAPTDYMLTHISSGFGLCALPVPTEDEARVFLSAVADLDPVVRWNVDGQELLLRSRDAETWQAKIDIAHHDALSPIQTCLMMEDEDGCVIDETPGLPDPKSPYNVHKAYTMLRYTLKVKRVFLLTVDVRTGKQTLIDSYTKSKVYRLRRQINTAAVPSNK